MMNYKDTVFLPRTDFPMRGNLPIREPQILQNWQDINIYEKLRDARKDAPTFVLHDGPPYANGQLHIGHALNKILKDVINRSQSMLGKNANYVPGWDCHGLQSNGKLKNSIAKRARIRTTFQLPNSVRCVGILHRIGWMCNPKNFSDLVYLVIGLILTPR